MRTRETFAAPCASKAFVVVGTLKMMKNILPALLASLFVLSTYVAGCHVGEHGAEMTKKRAKRQTVAELDITKDLREYFTSCLLDKVGEIWSWKSVIDYTILDTFWYFNSGSSNCSVAANSDTVECWKQRVTIYLRNSSYLIPPCYECIDAYGNDTSNGIITYTVVGGSSILSANKFKLCTPPDPDQPFRPNSPELRRYDECNINNVMFPTARDKLDFPTVFQFIDAHTQCGSEFADCDANNQAIITQTEPEVTRWPYRYDALTLDSSPLKPAIALCNDRVFPPTNPVWTSWSSCSATCGGGEQTRSLNCQESVCATTRSQKCNENLCPMCQISTLTRKTCGSSLSKKQCLSIDCCYDQGRCYRKDDAMTITNFAPTVQPDVPFGGEPGFPGSTLLRCNSLLRNRRCRVGNRRATRTTCSRVGCCWDSVNKLCYRASFTFTRVRPDCPPGFTNPPRCDDINECTASPCMNGGTCRDMINSFECDCPVGTFGSTCRIDCPSPPVPIDGFFETSPVPSLSQFVIGQVVFYFCEVDAPVQLEGPLTNLCLPSGTWSNAAPVCKEVCVPLPVPIGGFFTTTIVPTPLQFTVGDAVSYFCTSPRVLVGADFNVCQPSGNWLNSVPLCNTVVAICSLASLPVPTEGSFTTALVPTPANFPEGSVVNYVCNAPRVLDGISSNMCTSGGAWANGAPLCRNVCSLASLPVPTEGSFTTTLVPTPTNFPEGSVVSYICNSPRVLDGISSNMCTSGGAWANGAPLCRNVCSLVSLPIPTEGSFTTTLVPTPSNFPEGSVVNYVCNAPRVLNGISSNMCTSSGAWGNTAPICKFVCPIPPIPTGGFFTSLITPNPVQFEVGAIVNYFCSSPLVLDGSSTNLCASNGVWSNTVPICKTVCPPPPSPANGSHEPMKTVYDVGNVVIYNCFPDFPVSGPTTNMCLANGGWANGGLMCG